MTKLIDVKIFRWRLTLLSIVKICIGCCKNSGNLETIYCMKIKCCWTMLTLRFLVKDIQILSININLNSSVLIFWPCVCRWIKHAKLLPHCNEIFALEHHFQSVALPLIDLIQVMQQKYILEWHPATSK